MVRAHHRRPSPAAARVARTRRPGAVRAAAQDCVTPVVR
jgi:hypothetical protein